MIHLDTNYLIGLLVKGSPQAIEVDGWLAAGESLAASADDMTCSQAERFERWDVP